jgi:hypothetical protein
MAVLKRPVASDERPVTSDKRSVASDERSVASDERPVLSDERRDVQLNVPTPGQNQGGEVLGVGSGDRDRHFGDFVGNFLEVVVLPVKETHTEGERSQLNNQVLHLRLR